MFVMNCKVLKDEVLRYEPPQQRNSGKKRKKGHKGKLVHEKDNDSNLPTIAGAASMDHYHPVTCSECSSEVAVYDTDEVYHFFNVLASHAWIINYNDC